MVKSIKKINKRRVLSLVLAAFLIFGMVPLTSIVAHAATTTNQSGGTAGTWNYTLVNGTATNVYCSSYLSGAVTIPSYLDGYPVISIGGGAPETGVLWVSRTYVDYSQQVCLAGGCYCDPVSGACGCGCFQYGYATVNNTSLTQIIVPSTVTTINAYAFYSLLYVTSVTIPSSITAIDATAFSGMNSYVDRNAPSTTVTVTGATASIKMADVVGINAWAVTSSTAQPSSWTGASNLKSYTASWTATTNGTYYAWSSDINGNMGYVAFTVTGCDANAPSISLAPNTTAPTQNNVTITATITDASSYTSKWATGSQTTEFCYANGTAFSGSFAVSANGVYTVYALDQWGNGAVKTITVNNIDKTAPTVALTASPTAATSNSVVITATVTDTNTVTTKWATTSAGASTGTTFSGNFSVSTNGTYYVYALDAAGNSTTSSIVVGNIDKAAPSLNLSASTSAPTNGNVTITASTTDTNAVTTKWETTSAGASAGTAFNGNFSVSTNGTYYVYAVDSVGNSTTSSIVVNNIDKEKPSVIVTPSTTDITNGDVTVTVAVSNETSVTMWYMYWSTSAGTFVGDPFNGSFVASSNKEYEIHVKDAAGNETLKFIAINNIDKTVPVVTLSASSVEATSGDITITTNVTDTNTVTTKWASTSAGAPTGTAFNGSFTVPENGMYYVYALDAVGNSVTTSINVGNIDKTAPVLTLTPSTTGATASVEVTATASDINTVSTKWANTSDNAPSGTAFSGSFVVSENGTYYVYVVDSVGNSTVYSIVINNIDVTAPSAPSISCSATENTFSVAGGADDGSGVAGTYYRINDGEWITYSAPVTVEDGTYTIDAKVVDNANNESSFAIASMTAYKNTLALATSVVESAEAAKTQSSVDYANAVISTLPTVNEKTSLQGRIASVQNYIDVENAYATQLATATSAVETSENSKAQADVNSATVLVNGLRDTDKSALSARLVAVQTQIDYNNLLTSATSAVVTAETSKAQADVDRATVLVNQLNASDAAPLTARLAEVQTYINNKAQFDAAEASVVLAEKYKQAYYTNKALTLVNALPESDGKDFLLLRLEAVSCGCDVSQFTAAIAAVEAAEASEAQGDIDNAQSLVNALPSSSATKADLTNRVNALILATSGGSQGSSEAMVAVADAETSCTQDDYDYAYGLVSVMEDSSAKTLLMSRLSAIIPCVNATNAVEAAEAALSMETYFSANTTVTALTDGDSKADLQTRLATLLTILYNGNSGTSVSTATSAVETAEKYKTSYYYNRANTLVVAMLDSVIKDHLGGRLSALVGGSSTTTATSKATVSVVNAEKYRTEYYVDKALTLVTALPDGTTKTSLTTRLLVVINELEAKKLTVATAYVTAAEASQVQADVTTAYKYVNALNACAEKTALLSRLDTVQGAIDLLSFDADLKEATTYVVKAESSLTEYYYNKALGLVNDLMNSAEKTALLERLAAVRTQLDVIAVANATTAVERVEKYKTQYYYDTAASLVSSLPSGDAKTALEARLAVVVLAS